MYKNFVGKTTLPIRVYPIILPMKVNFRAFIGKRSIRTIIYPHPLPMKNN